MPLTSFQLALFAGAAIAITQTTTASIEPEGDGAATIKLSAAATGTFGNEEYEGDGAATLSLSAAASGTFGETDVTDIDQDFPGAGTPGIEDDFPDNTLGDMSESWPL